MRIVLLLIFCTFVCVGKAATFDVRSFGATGDGVTIDSPAIQRAIDSCTQAKGGVVVVPKGTYLCTTIVIKDNVTLRIEKDAVLLGVIDPFSYQMIDAFTDGLGIAVGRTFIAAIDAKNIAIEGQGSIDGRGAAVKAKLNETDTRPEAQKWGERPFLLRIIRCKGVRVEGVSLKYSASWTSHYSQCSDVVIKDMKIESVGVSHNDGIDIDGCQNVRISDCDIVSGDDALCFKTTHSQYPCRDIVVTNMRLKSNQAAIKMGTESMAAFESIKISNCHIYDTKNGGIKLLTVDGAKMRNIEISNIEMDNVCTPILLRLGSRLNVFRKGKDVAQQTGTMENITIKNLKAVSAPKTQLTSASAILITGVPSHYIKNLTMENIDITLPGGASEQEAEAQVPLAIDQYPEVKTFGPTIPAYAIWMRYVDGVTMNNLVFRTQNRDMRPAVVCEQAKNVFINDMVVDSNSTTRVVDSQNVQITITKK